MTTEIINTQDQAQELDPVELLAETRRVIERDLSTLKLAIKEANKELRKIEKLDEQYVNDKTERLTVQRQSIEQLTKQKTDLELDLKDLTRTGEDENNEAVAAAMLQIKQNLLSNDNSIAYIIKDDEFVYITDMSTVKELINVQIVRLKPTMFVEDLASRLKLKTWHLKVPLIKDLFYTENRSFLLSRYSVNPGAWDSSRVYLPFKHMEKYFIDHVELTDAELATGRESIIYFDMLMYSLSGGKKENQDHLEKFILHKVINYRKQSTTPDLVIVGHVGGNGKGILQMLIRLMFPQQCSGKANAKTLNGNFNAIMMGKLIVFFDDQDSKEIPLEIVKQLAGSDTMIYEEKGKDQFEGEKTHSSAWFANKMPFRLTPGGQEGGVDRRFSIMRTNITFLESIRHHYAQTTGEEMSVEHSKEVAELIVSKHLFNRVNIAAWFQHLQAKHPEVDANYTLKALHGEDYHYFLEDQQNSYETIFHQLVKPVLEVNGCVPIFVIKELIRHLDGRSVGDKTIFTKMVELCSQNKFDVVTDRSRLTIVNNIRSQISKQCSVIHLKNNDWIKEFDWPRVSKSPYTGTTIGDLIKEDDLTFGNGFYSRAEDSLFEEENDPDFE